jgi:cell division transport system permease protein
MRLRLLVSEAWRSLGANISTTFAATLTVLVGMFLLGLFIALGSWTLSWSDHIKRELMVKVYFDTKPEATRQQENAVAQLLSSRPDVVESWKFVTKEQGLERMRKTSPELVQNLASNPLPDLIEIKPTNAENMDAVLALLKPLPRGVEEVDRGKKYEKRVLQVARVLQIVVTIATVTLLAAATLLIANTIRLSIFSRRREIEVMKLVGATNWFIRGPFMIEGVICGVAGALIAVILLALGKMLVLDGLGLEFSGDADVKALTFPVTAGILLLSGFLLGALGSGLTIRRFLKV